MKYIFKTFIALTLIFFISCEDKLADLSVDPDDVTIANDSEVLTSAQGYLGIVQDFYLNAGSFLWAQYYTWGIGVSIGNAERYVSQPDDEDFHWELTYSRCLTDLKYLSKSESAAYRGVSKILTAYVFQGLVDHFGDVPYFEALNGEIADGGNVTPAFDGAAVIYADLIVSLDEAIAELELAVDGDIGSDDLVFGGDLDQWVKFANSLKLRILMRTSEVDAKNTEVIALINSGDFLEDINDVAEISWPGITGNENPMYAIQMSGVGDFYFASNASVNVLNNLADPRLDFFYAQATKGPFIGTIRGIDQGTIDNEPFTADAADYSGSSPYANGPAVSTILMSPWEVWFLRAEADARYGTTDDDVSAFSNAIQLNFDHMGAGNASTYIASLSYGGSLDAKLDNIAVQSWIAFNGTQEDQGWTVTRRFDRPASRLFTSGIFQNPPLSVLPAGTHPASWLYPAEELSFNPNRPAQRAITDRLFWDN
jgi:hypothetical protein